MTTKPCNVCGEEIEMRQGTDNKWFPANPTTGQRHVCPGGDAAMSTDTRENEGPCICDGCEHNDTDACIGDPVECLAQMGEQAADDAIKARKERDL